MIIPTAKRIPYSVSGAQKVHPTIGYRLWSGTIAAEEPIVALGIIKAGERLFWARTSHRASPSFPIEVLFSPIDEEACQVQVAFCIEKAFSYANTVLISSLVHPAPEIRGHFSGEIATIGRIQGNPCCDLLALVLVRSDVKSVRNGVWHAKVSLISETPSPWNKMLSYGRTGVHDLA